MELLTKEQEETLQRLVDLCKNEKREINCYRDVFERSIIDYLLKIEYLENHIKSNSYGLYVIALTEEGKNYFNKKLTYQKQIASQNKKERNEKIVGWIRWVITTAIAVAALFISIFL